MGLIEISLIILGVVVLIISFVVPAGKAEGHVVQTPQVDEKMIKDLVEKQIDGAKNHINDMVDETLNYSMEKTERAMERLTNEKIMAINEYSEQVLTAINKNHQEVMFLYDMLNNKHENLVNTVSEASRRAKEIRQTVQDAEITVKEATGMMVGDAENLAGSQEGVEKTQPVEDTGKKAGDAGQEVSGTGETVPGDEGQKGDFVPIVPKRVELVQGAIVEEPASGTVENRETLTEPEAVDEKNHNNNDKILRLHKLGKSKTAIARELGLGVGEVKLVIDLFEQ